MRLFDMDSREDYLLDGRYKVATPYAPLVDVVEVVRCKDCKHESYCSRMIRPEGHLPDDYCSFGERRSDE